MRKKWLEYLFFFTVLASAFGQNNAIHIQANLAPSTYEITIKQEIVFHNQSQDTLRELYLFDWANSFSTKTSPLGKRFAEDYISAFHFEKEEDRGKTTIKKINDTDRPLQWQRDDAVDILKVLPADPILPKGNYRFNLEYVVKIPDAKFTRFGRTKNEEFYLQHWFISPAVYDGSWQIYSNTNTDDLYLSPTDFRIDFTFPEHYHLTSNFNVISQQKEAGKTKVALGGTSRTAATLYLEKKNSFNSVSLANLELTTNLFTDRLSAPFQAVITDRIVNYLENKLGPYPFEKMVISAVDYYQNPVYGLNLLPDFLSPFPDGFELDVELLKSITRHYINDVLVFHPRKDYWFQSALQIYLMMDYVETFYPQMKIAGKLSNWWLVQWAHAAGLEFNDQYQLLYLNMARLNLHQALNLPKDKLLKFNMNIANPYYGGSGLKYLEDYLEDAVLDKALKSFFADYMLKPITTQDFQQHLKSYTSKDIQWFFDDFVQTNSTIDFRIKSISKAQDSLEIKIKNLRKTQLPVSVYGLDKERITSKTWTEPIDSMEIVKIAAKDVDRVALNYEGIIPEYNRRNNFKTVNGILNKPLQIRPFQDIENPNYSQLFFMPVFQYNLYDGLSLGLQLYNKTLLPKALHYSIEPQYGFTSNTLVGGGSILYTQFTDEENLFAIRYGFSGKYYSYDRDLFYKRFSPYITFAFRPNDLRKHKRQYLNLRSVNVDRDQHPELPNPYPNYNVFNLQYVYLDTDMINYFKSVTDYQISSKFSKLSLQMEYRKLFLNNRQLNLRFFGGVFLFNDSKKDDDYFSFALDRPTDYMFDYNYYGRSETSGLFSQQLIISEGGFKSKLDTPYADNWMLTINASTNIWRWIYAYADGGLVHNRTTGTKALYDSGIRISLVADYFEIYLPMFSSLGFEPQLPDYDQKIRFIVTLSPETLFKLFTRRWY